MNISLRTLWCNKSDSTYREPDPLKQVFHSNFSTNVQNICSDKYIKENGIIFTDFVSSSGQSDFILGQNSVNPHFNKVPPEDFSVKPCSVEYVSFVEVHCTVI